MHRVYHTLLWTDVLCMYVCVYVGTYVCTYVSMHVRVCVYENLHA
jgi:hypothetical protein